MEVRIYTLYDDVVLAALKERKLLDPMNTEHVLTHGMVFHCASDDFAQEWREWIAGAMICGLIEGGYVK